MKNYLDYFKDDDIIFYLCKIRVSYAQKRNKKHLLNNLTSKEYQSTYEEILTDKFDKDLLDELNQI